MRRLLRSAAALLVTMSILFPMSCCSRNSSQPVSNKDEAAIEAYLDQKVLVPVFGGKVFSAFKVLGTAEGKVYVWAFMQEYYKKDNLLEEGTGWSVPLVLEIEKSSNGIVVKGHKSPGDGTLYEKDVKTLFPKELQQVIFDFPASQSTQELENISKNRAEQWAKNKAYNYKDEDTSIENIDTQSSEKTTNDEGIVFEPTIAQNEAGKLTDKEIAEKLFSMYLEHYKNPSRSDGVRLNAYKNISVREVDKVSDDLIPFKPIYHVSYSVQTCSKQSNWCAGNGEISDDNWIIGKSLFVRLAKEKELYRLVLIGTGM